MKSALISIGTELLFGQIVNTNAAYISKKLNELGIDVLYHYTMGDNPVRLRRILDLAFEDCELVICTGGLGPTEDDLTRETVCEYLGERLVYNEESYRLMEEKFKVMNFKMTDNNLKQNYIPEHGTVFQNGAGMAPGFAVEKNGKTVICLPGVPREMTTMFQQCAEPYLMKLMDAHIVSNHVKIFGLGESNIETMLMELVDAQTDPTIATYAKEGLVEVRITSKRREEVEAWAAVTEMSKKVVDIIGDYVYSTDGKELYQVLGKKLIERNISVSVCELPTGGMLSSELVKYPGISKVFDRGFVLYGDTAVKDELSATDPYSSGELVRKLYEKTGSRLCIAVTGAAGPDNYGDMEPGEYLVSIMFDGQVTDFIHRHEGRTRDIFREFIVNFTVFSADRVIDGKAPVDTEGMI